MTKTPLLTVAYLERLPESSARVLAAMRSEDAAALLETLPTRIVTPIIEKMEKWPAARCLHHFSAANAGAILGEVSYQAATVLLRLTSAEQRDAIFKQMPSRLARSLRESLRYPRNCVGAWMDLSVPTLSRRATIKEALSLVRAAQRPVGETIFVVDDAQRVAGFVNAETLLRYGPNTRLVDIMQTGLKPLFARMLLREAESDLAWSNFLRLPVAGRDGQLLGTLSRQDLKHGLTTIVLQPGAPDTGAMILSRIGEAFIASMAALIQLLDTDDTNANRSMGS